MSGGRRVQDNSEKVAQIQAATRAQELQFEREEAARQATFYKTQLEQQRIADERRNALDLKADARATDAASFNRTLAEQQLAYQTKRDAELYGLQKQGLEYAEADRLFYRSKATREEERITAKEQTAAAAEAARKASAESGYNPFKASLEGQLRSGLIGFSQAQDYLREYTTKYDMFGKEGDVNQFAKLYSEEIAPKRFETGLGAAYEEVLGRKASEEEMASGLEKFKGGYYQTVNELKESLYKGQEYQKKFNRSYLDSYYDTMYGDELKDAEGVGTGKRNFKFDKNLLPTYGGDLAARTKVTLPNFADQFEGTPAEVEQQLQNVRDSRQFLYGAGLTNLQGEIDKETQKLKNEGAKEVQKIAAQGDIYKSLVGSFSF
jgi:hypothetical protein